MEIGQIIFWCFFAFFVGLFLFFLNRTQAGRIRSPLSFEKFRRLDHRYSEEIKVISLNTAKAIWDKLDLLSRPSFGDYFQDICDGALKRSKPVSIIVDNKFLPILHLEGNFSDDTSGDEKPEIDNLELLGGISFVTVDRMRITNITIAREFEGTLILRRCWIKSLVMKSVTRDKLPNVQMLNCAVNLAELNENCCHDLSVTGGEIVQFLCPRPRNDNPFSGSVNFTKVNIISDQALHNSIEGVQSLRNLRLHLTALDNLSAASQVFVAEKRIERRHEAIHYRAISKIYDLFSAYGWSVFLPLAWLTIVVVGFASVAYFYDGAVVTRGCDKQLGWDSIACESDIGGRIARSAIFAVQALNPFGLFAVDSVVKASTPLFRVLQIMEGLISLVLLSLVIIALRRRFKLG